MIFDDLNTYIHVQFIHLQFTICLFTPVCFILSFGSVGGISGSYETNRNTCTIYSFTIYNLQFARLLPFVLFYHLFPRVE